MRFHDQGTGLLRTVKGACGLFCSFRVDSRSRVTDRLRMRRENTVSPQCSVCQDAFVFRHAWQRENNKHYCSLPCRARADVGGCAVCGRPVEVRFAYQALEQNGVRMHVCSQGCYSHVLATTTPPQPAPRAKRYAVLNQKGGTGKTTTAVSLAAGLAERGKNVLLIDADPQGSVAVSLGVNTRRTFYQVLVKGMPLDDALVPIAKNLDVLAADGTLAHAELAIAQDPEQGALVRRRLEDARYDAIVIDCGPSMSMLNQSVLTFVDEVIVPVACEYLALVGVKTLMETLRRVNLNLGHPVEIGAVIPTFYDGRTKGCREALETLHKHFGEKCSPPVRHNVRIKEAPRHKKTIFEYAPESKGAADYNSVVAWLCGEVNSPAASVPQNVDFGSTL